MGKSYSPEQIVRKLRQAEAERATGRSMETEPYLRYLQDKFGRLYGF